MSTTPQNITIGQFFRERMASPTVPLHEYTRDQLFVKVKKLQAKLKFCERHNTYLQMELDVACKHGCAFGDGNVGVVEWFGLMRFDDGDQARDYLDWLDVRDTVNAEDLAEVEQLIEAEYGQ